MEFDLFTFIAQVVNFSILVFLLNKFLFARVRQAMEEREKRVSQELESARAQNEAAQRDSARAREILDAAAAQGRGLLAKAEAEAEAESERMMSAAEFDAKRAAKEWEKAALGSRDIFLHRLKGASREAALAIARKAVTDLSDAELEERLVMKFAALLRSGAIKGEEALREAVIRTKTVDVMTAFPAGEEQRRIVEELIRERYGAGVETGFSDAAGEGGWFIRLESGGISAEWGIETYLDGLEENIKNEFESLKTSGKKTDEKK